jgi:tetratricopeptide (TPR) repeat protein
MLAIKEEIPLKFLNGFFTGKKAFALALLLFLIPWGGAFVSAQANTAEPVLVRISELLAVSRYDEAIALFDTIAPQERDSSRINLLKASVLSSAGKYTEARAIVEAVSSREPNNIDALFVLAAIEGVQGRARQQQAALERIIGVDPDNAEALVALGNISLSARNYRPAASYFHRVLTNDERNVDALLGLARTFRLNGEYDAAEPLVNRAVQLYPAHVEARSERARFFQGKERLREALADLDEAKRLAPGDYWIAIDRGNILLNLNRREEALEEFNRAIAIDSGQFLAYVYTSGLKDDLGDHDGAERDYAILARLRPDYYFALEGYGLHKMRKEQWAEARNAFMEAYRQAPDEHLYALLAAMNWMRAENIASPRTFLSQTQAKVKRDTLEWYMFRLYYDLTVRSYAGENDMVIRVDREQDQNLKARMMFYMAQYYDIRGNTSLANKYYLLVREMEKRGIPEWRLNEWIVIARNLQPF